MVQCLLMVQWVIGSIPHVEPCYCELFLVQCSMTGVTKAVVCAILSMHSAHFICIYIVLDCITKSRL